MPTTKEISLPPVNIASTKRFKATILKDGVAWLGIDSVAFVFEKPDRDSGGVGTQFSRAATNELPDAGVWYYDSTTTDFVDGGEGYWTLQVRPIDGAIIEKYDYEIGFEVVDLP